MYDVLNRFVILLEPIIDFLDEKKQTYPQLKDKEWLYDLMFFTDTMEHLKKLNLLLQGKDKNISELSQSIFSFKRKIQLFEQDVMDKTFNHFPRLKEAASEYDISLTVIINYQTKLKNLYNDFEDRFTDLVALKPSIAFLLNPFEIDIHNNGFKLLKCLLPETASGEIELIDMQEDQGLHMLHKSAKSINEFWKCVPAVKYNNLKIAAYRLLSIFGSTYDVESLYSTMKLIKSKFRSQLTNQHLKELIRCSTTNYQPDFQKLTFTLQTHQPSTSKK
ncbi:general transcription factor II-I repeat domain-containing protein 2-like [Onthophagus taurus]|uniref:general transcription factor II-I repeat domain-containing protein 2-like n=1 Tax=Onthophagus taurus TaxID=166361 RepID=UPI0039BE2379